MTANDLYKQAANGDHDALVFLVLWHEYVHAIDDIIDEGRGPEYVINTFLMAHILYTTPFHLKWALQLKMLITTITNSYADSVAWAKKDGWRQRWADVLRFSGIEMVMAVACICGGPQHMRDMSDAVRAFSWDSHHDEEGNSV